MEKKSNADGEQEVRDDRDSSSATPTTPIHVLKSEGVDYIL